MANVTVHSSLTHVDIHFNDLSSLSGVKDDILPKLEVRLTRNDDNQIVLRGKYGAVYTLSFDELDALNVDSVNIINVTSKEHLFELLEFAIGATV